MPKKGPPYDVPPEPFLVVTNVWCMNPVKSRTQACYNKLGAWIRYVLREEYTDASDDVLADTVYSRSTEDAVILKLSRNCDIKPYIGAHEWGRFLTEPFASKLGNGTSYIWHYNYRNNGDPASHNWSEHYPTAEAPPPSFPVKVPHPHAEWAPVPANLLSLVHPLPRPQPPPLGHEPPNPLPVTLAAEPTLKPGSSFDEKNYSAQFLDKRDPDEEEEYSKQFLKVESSIKIEGNVKQELRDETDYQPSEELLATMSTLNPLSSPRGNTTQYPVNTEDSSISSRRERPPTIKAEVKPEDSYAPAEDLIQVVLQHQAQTGQSAPASQSPRLKVEGSSSDGGVSRYDHNFRRTQNTIRHSDHDLDDSRRKRVKREDDTEDVTSSLKERNVYI